MARAVREIMVAAALLAVSLFFLFHLVRATDFDTMVALSPTSMPLFVISLVTFLSLLLLLSAFLRWRAWLAAGPPAEARPPSRTEDAAVWRGPAFFVWTVLYLIALPWTGYLLATITYTGGLAGLFGNRRPLSIVLLMGLVPLTLILFFERYLRIWLPAGRLFQ